MGVSLTVLFTFENIVIMKKKKNPISWQVSLLSVYEIFLWEVLFPHHSPLLFSCDRYPVSFIAFTINYNYKEFIFMCLFVYLFSIYGSYPHYTVNISSPVYTSLACSICSVNNCKRMEGRKEFWEFLPKLRAVHIFLLTAL